MILQDYHVHTTFCDGNSQPEETVLSAISRGMQTLGFSGHSHTAFDESWCMSREGTAQYRQKINELKEKYASEICILCGVEQDFYSDASTVGYDYVIGSVHYLLADGEYVPVDESAEHLKNAAKAHFGGDLYALTEAYFETVGQVCEKTGCDLIGHFDLISKFNESGALFDESDPRYVAAWQKAADRLLCFEVPFEINTGAIARGYRSAPYPAAPILRYLKEHGARFLYSSDCHHASKLCFQFENWQKQLGITGENKTFR